MSFATYAAALIGLDAPCVEVEADVSPGLPNFFIVGLPDLACAEARQRVKPAIQHTGFPFPYTRVTVNLAPATVRKEGARFDLAIATAILGATGMLDQTTCTEKTRLIGELALDGRVRPVSGMLAMAIAARDEGAERIFVPEENAKEAALVSGIAVYATPTLSALVGHLHGTALIPVMPLTETVPDATVADPSVDLAHVRGQAHAKRVLEIAAAGGHNILLSGPPGSGKTLLARTLPTILPPMTLTEALEVTKIWSVAGMLPRDTPLIWTRPFRSPHHTASAISLVGGGASPRPGEVSLAHRGVLFADEFPEFSRAVLENLRQPLEDACITISRAAGTIRFPARFMLVAAMNPCPCGYASDPSGRCSCNQLMIQKYQKRISGPLLDRIDLAIEVPRVDAQTLVGPSVSESSASVRERVIRARERQHKRFRERGLYANVEMSAADVKKFVVPDEEAIKLLTQAIDALHLSARALTRTLKVARTIADIDARDDISAADVAEALRYRPRVE